MRVVFERYDERRYGIGIVRDGRRDVGADVPVRPGPGHAAVPHDLVHFVVEEQAGLTLGVFGQVAAGGDAHGFFRPAPADRTGRDRKRSERVGRAGREQVSLSEQLAALVGPGGTWAPSTRELIGDPRLEARLRARLAEVLGRWRATPPGERLVLDWPDRLIARPETTNPAVRRRGRQGLR
jgi:hypothetical protein